MTLCTKNNNIHVHRLDIKVTNISSVDWRRE